MPKIFQTTSAIIGVSCTKIESQGPDSSLRKLDGNGKYGRYLPLPLLWSKFAIHERCCVTRYHDDMLGVSVKYTVWSDPTGNGLGNVIL